MKTVIVYHRDMDGLASALIARKRYPDAKLVSIQYGEEPVINWYKYHMVIIVDFSFDRRKMKSLSDSFHGFIWIDHHQTAMEDMPELWKAEGIRGVRNVKKSACELTWNYFFPDKDIPYGIELIGDRDTWTFKYKQDTKDFNEAMKLHDIEKDIDNIEEILFLDNDSINDIIDRGADCYAYMMAEVKRLYKKGRIDKDRNYDLFSNDGVCIYAHHMCPVFICYSNSYISELANYALEQGGCEIAEIRQRIYDKKKRKWITSVSLRSKKNGVDVSKIAEAYGGGGNPGAAGFMEDD